LLPASVLIVSDDPGFARTLAARWQAERHVPEITMATGSVWHPAGMANQDLVIIGPLRDSGSPAILRAENLSSRAATIYFVSDAKKMAQLQSDDPHLLIVPQTDGWAGTIVLVATEALRRIEAVRRAQRAEGLALLSQAHATLGRYMLEMRPNINNALTSVVGNADLLLLEPGQSPAQSREQIETIHTMALRLNEIMQRFSSLAAEMRAGEKESQAETQPASYALAGCRAHRVTSTKQAGCK
jgi:signal transduction histidine kinase